jgi:hypothetical protein
MQSAVVESTHIEPTEPPAPEPPALTVRRWLTYQEDREVADDDFIFDAPGVEAIASLCAGVILPTGDEQRAATLLASGATCVFVGEAALNDSTVIDRLVATHGAGRIGIYAPVRRQSVSWSFETVSNADFKTITPSHCEPAWEVLRADGTGTGTLAHWWLAAMREKGASCFLVQVDIADDTDLNLCAGLVEELGGALWIGPLAAAMPNLADWVDFGQCQQIVLSAADFAQCDCLSAEAGGSA